MLGHLFGFFRLVGILKKVYNLCMSCVLISKIIKISNVLSYDLLHNITVLSSNKKVRNVLFRATALPSVIKI